MALENRRFLGRGWRFPPSFDWESGGVAMVEAERDIRESLFILMSTLRGERVMLPDYGLGLQLHVFDGTDNTTLSHLRNQIEDAILYFEPRIKLENVSIDAAEHLDGRLLVNIDYTIPSINSRSNMVFPFYFTEGTNIENRPLERPGRS